MTSEQPQITVKIVGGPDNGTEMVLDGPEIHIGRETGSQLQLTDPTVSRKHAVLARRDGRWCLRHLAVGNSSHVNGRSVDASGDPEPLRSGDRISLGQTVIVTEFRHTGLTDSVAANRDAHEIAPDQSIRLGTPPPFRPAAVGDGRPVAPFPLKRLAAPLAVIGLLLLFLLSAFVRNCAG